VARKVRRVMGMGSAFLVALLRRANAGSLRE
jgi:hypothetical protein